MAAALVGVLLREFGSGSGGSEGELTRDRAAEMAAALIDRPDRAASMALEEARANPSVATEMGMLDVALDGRGLERVVQAGPGSVSTALVLDHLLVTAGEDGSVKVWDREDGALLGETEAAAPLVALADMEQPTPYLAALDAEGRVALVDVASPAGPRVMLLGARLAAGERPLAVAFAELPDQVVALGSGGKLLRVDQTNGELLGRESVTDYRGYLPWSNGTADLELTAARFAPEHYEDEEALLVATAAGAVVDLDIAQGQGKTVVSEGIAPGRVLSLDYSPYGTTELVVGTSRGYLYTEEEEIAGEPTVMRGPPVPAVAIDIGGFWRGESGGVALPDDYGLLAGPPVLGFAPGRQGVAALNPGGRVSVLAAPGAGIEMEETEETTIASFEPGGLLLVAYGYDPNHIEEIRAVRPQPALESDEWLPEDVVHTYRPDPDWWPYAEEPDALYLNDVESDGELVVAAGQNPEGDAAVMVWDAASGEPLQHLPVGAALSTSEISIATQVLLLPGRKQIATYSAAQELLMIWSTETWELQDSIPVGPLGSIALSPDEATILTAEIPPEAEYEVDTDAPVALGFVDVARGELDHEVEVRGAVEVAFSADGETIAVADAEGRLQLRSADGHQIVGDPIDLAGGAITMAWRPDGGLLAVALDHGDVVLVDPETGEVSAPLPYDEYEPSLGLSWSADGALLAQLTAEEDEADGEGFDPGPARIWTLGREALEARMCQLVGCLPEEEGARAVPASAELAFLSDGEHFLADTEGNAIRVGEAEEFARPPLLHDWSAQGVAWSSPGQVGVLLNGAEQPRSWPCACAGVAWQGGELVSVTQDGSSLVRIDPRTGALRREPLAGLPPFSPVLLGVVAGTPIVAVFEEEPYRSTPSVLFGIEPSGVAKRLADARGTIYRLQPSSSPDALAFVAGLSSGACYSTENVGIVSAGRRGAIEVGFPPPPLGEEPAVVRSVQVAEDGTASATVAPVGCDDSGSSADRDPRGTRYLLEDGRWLPDGGRAYDTQTVAGAGMVEVGLPEALSAPRGPLVFVSGGERRTIAEEVETVVARP